MKYCQGCGGIVGRDCFNEIECMSISAQQNHYDEQYLLAEIELLKKTLKENGIPIPELNKQHEITSYQNNTYDEGMPF